MDLYVRSQMYYQYYPQFLLVLHLPECRRELFVVNLLVRAHILRQHAALEVDLL